MKGTLKQHKYITVIMGISNKQTKNENWMKKHHQENHAPLRIKARYVKHIRDKRTQHDRCIIHRFRSKQSSNTFVSSRAVLQLYNDAVTIVGILLQKLYIYNYMHRLYVQKLV